MGLSSFNKARRLRAEQEAKEKEVAEKAVEKETVKPKRATKKADQNDD